MLVTRRTLVLIEAVLLALAALLLAACAGDSEVANPLVPGSTGIALAEPTLYVAPGGSDTNDGASPGTAFATITHAMAVAVPGDVVQVAGGTYSAPSGEVFPIQVPGGVILQGDPATRGSATIITGSTTGGVVEPQGGSKVIGFTITNTGGGTNTDAAVYVAASQVVVGANRLVNSTPNGLVISIGGDALHLVGNTIDGNNTWGVRILAGVAGLRAENNRIANNGSYGIAIDPIASGLDFGGGPNGSAGGNAVICNTSLDVWIDAGFTGSLWIRNSAWDAVPPRLGGVSTGFEILDPATNGYTGSVDAAGATLAPGACP